MSHSIVDIDEFQKLKIRFALSEITNYSLKIKIFQLEQEKSQRDLNKMIYNLKNDLKLDESYVFDKDLLIFKRLVA